MTTNEPARAPGYRGALPPREDRLARPWILLVIAAFVLILVLSVLGVPSRFIPEPTPVPPPPSVPAPSFSVGPSGSASPSASASASASASGSESASPSPTSE